MPSASTIAGTGATVPPDSRHPLRRRVASALVLIPVAVLAAVLGPPFWTLLVALFGAVMAWEWSRVCNRGRLGASAAILIIAVPGSIAAATFAGYREAFLLLFASALAGAVAARLSRERAPGWQGVGAVYVGVPCLAILWVRADPEIGLATLLWLLVLVWATDTGAYAAGRSLGGPRLAPGVSPNKTWAGLGGGMLSAAFVGLAAALWLGTPTVWILVAASAALGGIEQAGDLAESVFKRRFGAKDSSNIIPGHGGVLDRVDGLLAVAVAAAAASLIGGESILLWQ